MSIRCLPALGAALMMLAACTNDPAIEAPAAQMGQVHVTTEPPFEDQDTREYFETKVGNVVHFDTDAYSLSEEAQKTLQRQAAWLQLYPRYAVTIEGHADERGTREYNLALGERRAQAVMNYLIALGLDPKRLKTISYGKERPVCTAADEACWSQNRRGVSTLDN